MTHPMRRKDRETDVNEALELLSRGEYGLLSTIGPEGEPYGVPVSYALDGEELVFHCAPQGRKLANLAHHPRASFCVVGHTEVLPEKFSTRYESVIVSGAVRELLCPEKTDALALLANKYCPGLEREAAAFIRDAEKATRVFAIRLENLSGKRRA